MEPGPPTSPDRARTLAAWRAFVATGQIPRGELREHIDRAWRRAHAAGCRPDMPRAERLDPLETAQLLEREADLIAAARPYMSALSRAAGDARHAAMLADRDVVLLDVIGDEATVHDPDFPCPGSRMSEPFAGSNGLGTPIAEGRYVELEGPEHFIEGFHAFTCQGTPLRGADGELAGVLSTSVRSTSASERLREIMLCAAHGIEAELLRRRLEQRVDAAISASFAEVSLESLRQDVVQSQATARLGLQAAALRLRAGLDARGVELLQTANASIDVFRRRAELWRELADDERGAMRSIDPSARLADLVELLQTEAAIRGLTLRVRAPERPSSAVTDPRGLTKRAFRAILRAMELAPRGSSIDLRTVHASERGELSVVAELEGAGELARETLRLRAPAEPAAQAER